jgi:predicted DNA-binding protein (MmcQ/YjbR family)
MRAIRARFCSVCIVLPPHRVLIGPAVRVTGERVYSRLTTGGNTVADDVADRIREICLALPEAEERETWGQPTFRVREKIFALIRQDDGGLSVWCKAAPGILQALIASAPEHFFYPPYVGHKGWIGIRTDRDIDWEDVTDLIADSFHLIAPRKLVARMSGSGDG